MKNLTRKPSGEQFSEMVNKEFYNRKKELCIITAVSEVLGFVFIQYYNTETNEKITVSGNGRMSILFKSRHDLVLESNQLILNLPSYY